MNWFKTAVKRYAEFSGRSQRAEYWYSFLFYVQDSAPGANAYGPNPKAA